MRWLSPGCRGLGSAGGLGVSVMVFLLECWGLGAEVLVVSGAEFEASLAGGGVGED